MTAIIWRLENEQYRVLYNGKIINFVCPADEPIVEKAEKLFGVRFLSFEFRDKDDNPLPLFA